MKNDSKKTKSNTVIAGFDCPTCNKPLDINGLLSKYGPEGLYKLADLLKSVADEDVSDSFKQ